MASRNACNTLIRILTEPRRMAKPAPDTPDNSQREIRLIQDDDGGWSAIDETVGVASQGETRNEALENLDEAIALHKGEIGDPLENEAAFFREIGIDPDEVAQAREENDELPDFMQ